MARRMSEDQLRRARELLSDLLNERDEASVEAEPAWYAPPPPPLASGANLSATDLLSWWFRPPSGTKKSSWDAYFSDSREPIPARASAQDAEPKRSAASADSAIVSQAVWQAMMPETEDPLAAEAADAAVETLYAFLHAFGRGDIEGALQWVSQDYHVMEDDQEIDREGLRRRLESLLDSLRGWDIDVSLAAPPEALAHPYGIIIDAEIQIDGCKPGEMAVRSQSEHRVALLEKTGDSGWKIAALSRPRI